MNERKVLFRVAAIGLMLLFGAFVLLFFNADIGWWKLKATVINPMHTMIATGIMAMLGIAVYIWRNKRN